MNKEDIKLRTDRILSDVRKYNPCSDVEELRRAIDFAVSLYNGFIPEDRNDMLLQVFDVADFLTRMRMDCNGIMAALMQPALDSKIVRLEEIAEKIDSETAFLTEGIQKLFEITFRSQQQAQAENFRKMFLALSRDIRMILVRLAQRMEKQKRMSVWADEDRRLGFTRETLQIYAPLANRLGMHWIKANLEEQCFPVLFEDDYRKVSGYVRNYVNRHRADVEKVIEEIKGMMASGGVEGHVYGRIKQNYSIYMKMKAKKLELDEVPDIIAFRIVVACIEDCYKVLGMVHSHWRPIPGSFEDYVAMPKANGYQSLHTLVWGSYDERMEIQIRTEKMNEVAENGVAAHWVYKEGGKLKAEEISKTDWLRRLLEIRMDGSAPEDFIDALQVDFFSDRIFVFTPGGDVQVMQKGATALDFAFAVHSELGYRCCGVRVNHRIVPLRHELQNGDIVEIQTRKEQNPKREWLDFVVTSRARNKIRYAIRTEERERLRENGRLQLEKVFKNFGQNLKKLLQHNKLSGIPEKFKVKDLDELYMQIGESKLNPQDVLRESIPRTELDKLIATERNAADKEKEKEKKKVRRVASGKSPLRIEGLDDIMTHYGKCCNPVRGDDVVGFITRGRGVTIHRSDCIKLKGLSPDRILKAWWNSAESTVMPVRLRIVTQDQTGMLMRLSGIFSTHNINITSASLQQMKKDGTATCYFSIEVKDIHQLDMLSNEIRHQKGVLKVERFGG